MDERIWWQGISEDFRVITIEENLEYKSIYDNNL